MPIARSSNRVEAAYNHWEPLSDQEFALSMSDFEEYCKNSLVPDKNGIPVTFVLNEAQKKVAELVLSAMEPIINKDPTLKFHPVEIQILIHKARQQGITTVFLKLEEFIMSKSTNKAAVPEAMNALERFKYEVASEIGVPLTDGYNGDLTSKQNGSVGGYMVKKMIEAQERQMAGK